MRMGPELFAVTEVRTALVVGTLVAIATALIGVLTVLRGQSFAGHSLTDLASVGGSAAFLTGTNQLGGFVAASVLAALGMHAIGTDRLRGRDVATGIVLSAGMGITALLLVIATMVRPSGNSAMAVLFGSLFTVAPGTVPLVAVLAAICVLIVAAIWRPALFSTVSPTLARARGVRTGLVNALFMTALGIGVALGAVSVGAVLSTALLIGPAACGLRVARRIRSALLVAALLGAGSVWGGVIVSYESYAWTGGHAWSVSFCIVSLVLICFLASSGWGWARDTGRIGRRADA